MWCKKNIVQNIIFCPRRVLINIGRLGAFLIKTNFIQSVIQIHVALNLLILFILFGRVNIILLQIGS